ncbi:MAG: DUF397 domain-containing protein [Pseudonocardiaceae bacterium]
MNHQAAKAALRSCTQWRKSSYSFPDGNECVAITTELAGGVGVRETKLGADSPVLAFTSAQRGAMVAGACTGELI